MLLVVSGASRGFGQAVAEAFARHPSCRNAPMRVLLTARSESGLQETKRRMLESTSDDGPTGACIQMNVSIHPMDLGGGGDIDTLDNQLTELIDSAQPLDQYDRVVIVNNAGSLGHLGKIADMTSLHDFSHAIHLYITTSLWFTTRWTRALLSHRHATTTSTTANESTTGPVIVNVSSLCALEPFATMTTYCAGKAARDMFHQSLAKEEEHTIRVLNYAPGAMDTDMTISLREEGNQLDHGLKDFFQGAYEKGELIDPNVSAAKLVQLVCSGDFVSGSHVDYWDLPDSVAL
ncbi:short chain dehydrogenase [Fragilaria crotonensis]|nr:short chain dehydrogenase [Fragilaria crotonensis]